MGFNKKINLKCAFDENLSAIRIFIKQFYQGLERKPPPQCSPGMEEYWLFLSPSRELGYDFAAVVD
jgi:hypothetical protein